MVKSHRMTTTSTLYATVKIILLLGHVYRGEQTVGDMMMPPVLRLLLAPLPWLHHHGSTTMAPPRLQPPRHQVVGAGLVGAAVAVWALIN